MAKKSISAKYLKNNHTEIMRFITLWLCRSIVNGYMDKERLEKFKESQGVLTKFGLVIDDFDKITAARLQKIASDKLKELESSKTSCKSIFFTNFNYLTKQINLSSLESDVLLFSVIAKVKGEFNNNIELLGDFTAAGLVNSLALVLDIQPELVNNVLDSNSVLRKSGMIENDYSESFFTNYCLEIMVGLSFVLFQKHNNKDDFLSKFIVKIKKPMTSLKDFSHLGEDISVINSYLTCALKNKTEGVNILLYGPPGTGKTELAKVLAKKQTAELYDLRKDLTSNKQVTGENRLFAYQFTQELLSNKDKSIILFDEIEDVFSYSSNSFVLNVASSDKKSLINNILETNKVPAIWISNEIRQIDKAFIRRFDYVLHIPVPEREVRKNIITKQLRKYSLPDNYINNLADNKHLSNAHIVRARKVIDTIDINKSEDIINVMTNVLNNTLSLSNQVKIDNKENTNIINSYNLDYLETSEDMNNIIDVIEKGEGVRLCLHGMPGTGKTAFAKYLTETLNRPLHFTRASDILGKYVGETEKNISTLFEKGNKDNGIILLDEADSMMFSRSENMRTWQVSQINEMLSRLEEYEGVFIATTNRLELLDKAMLRRFDLTVEFQPITNEKKWHVFLDVIHSLGIKLNNGDKPSFKRKIESIHNLTVADFFNAKRKVSRFDKSPSIEKYINKLVGNSELKSLGKSKSMGFVR